MTEIRRLLKVTVRPTGKCERGCPDCYDPAYPIELSGAQVASLLNEIRVLKAQGVKVLVHITGGGEPLLYSGLSLLIKDLLEAGAEVTFTTSGCTGNEHPKSLDLGHLESISAMKSSKLGPVLSSKVTLPRWRERFCYSARKLSSVNGLVTVRRTLYENQDLLGLFRELGFSEVARKDTGPMPPTFYRKDLIVPGEDSCETIYQNGEGVTLQVITHRVIKTGRAKYNDRATAPGVSECPFLLKHPKPYVDIWPNGNIYPCFIIGPEIPELSLGILGQTTIKEALNQDGFEERRKRFQNGSPNVDCLCDKCRD